MMPDAHAPFDDNDELPDEDALAAARADLGDEPRERAFIFACRKSELPANGSRGKVIFCEHDEVAVFLIRGEVYAISNVCPHQLSPLLSEGYIDKDALTVACPLHGWTYRIDTGGSVVGGGGVRSYAVKLDGEDVWIEEPLPFIHIL